MRKAFGKLRSAVQRPKPFVCRGYNDMSGLNVRHFHEKLRAEHQIELSYTWVKLGEVIQEAKQMASQIREPSDLWGLERYLTERHKQIDRTYAYRYSQFKLVFGKLFCESRLGEEELRGLREDKLKSIRSYAKFLAEMDAAF